MTDKKRVIGIGGIFFKSPDVEISQVEIHEQGKFAWLVDLDGTKIELWEPK